MTRMMVWTGLAARAFGGIALSALPAQAPADPAPGEPAKICKSVVGAERGATPYKMCLTRAEWEAKKIADAKDATRLVCHYEEQPGTRFRSTKVCLTAAEWENQRQLERRDVERMQSLSCVPGAGC
jgi:hypothetical protein